MVDADTLSNAVSDGAITVDSSRNGWTGLISYPPDPIDATNQVDWASITLAHDSTYLYIRYITHTGPGSGSLWRYNLFLDTDKDRNTGYIGSIGQFSIGADYLIQGYNVYQFTGMNQSDWSWDSRGSGSYNELSNDFEFRYSQALIGPPTDFNWLAHGDNVGSGGVDDYAPNGANQGASGDFHTYVLPEPHSLALLVGAVAVFYRCRHGFKHGRPRR